MLHQAQDPRDEESNLSKSEEQFHIMLAKQAQDAIAASNKILRNSKSVGLSVASDRYNDQKRSPAKSRVSFSNTNDDIEEHLQRHRTVGM